MFINCTKPFFLCVIGLVSYTLYSQDKGMVDSLLNVYSKEDEIIDDSVKYNLYYNLAFYHSNPDTCIYFSNKLIENCNNDSRWLFRGYLTKGNAYHKQGKLEVALNCYFQSAKYLSTDKHKRKLGIIYCSLGDVYSSADNHKNSIQYYNKAINIFRELRDSIPLATALLNTGSQYLGINEHDTAYVYLNESLDIYNGYQSNKIGAAVCLGNIGIVYANRGRLSEAEAKLYEATTILKELGDNYSISAFYVFMAEALRKGKYYKKALNYVFLALDIAKENKFMAQIRDCSNELSDIYRLTGDYEKAFFYKSQYYAYRDSIRNDETISKMADLRLEFEISQKQAEVEKAQTQLALVKKEKQAQQVIGFALILIVFLISILAYVLFRNARRERETNNVLRDQKEELQAQRDMMEEINKTKDRFFSIISHDLRGPVGVLHWATTLIRDSLDSKDYELLDELTINMGKSVKKVQDLLDNLLEWAINQQGQYKLHPKNININACIQETVSIYKETANSKHINLTFTSLDKEVYLTIDSNSLSTIIRNLINNALKFTHKGGSVTVWVEQNDETTTLSVKDTGVGIPEEKLSHLFNIEAKKSTWGTNREKGLGIGLNLVYDFVKMNNGEITVNSAVDVGTIFIITFPTGSEQARFRLSEVELKEKEEYRL